MKHLDQIENWIENIEHSDLKPKIKAQKISALIDIWKFISYYNESIILKDEKTISFKDETHIHHEVELSVEDLVLKSSNMIQRILSETEMELGKEGSNYNGKYNIQFQRFDKNFSSQKLNSLKEELLSVVKGEMICFEHINYIHKSTSNKVELFSSNLKVIECEKTSIQKALNQTKEPDAQKKQWLLLVLDNLKNNCDTFLIQNHIKDWVFQSKFNKVFLFDFYKSQVVELRIEN